jgi:diguanylate cyclase (GGDEF)-like protein
VTLDPADNTIHEISKAPLFQKIIDATADGILIIDSDSSILNFNSQFLSVWDLDESDVPETSEKLTSTLKDKVTDPEEFLKLFTELFDDPETESIEEIELRNGRILELYSRPIHENDTFSGRLWSFNDITDRERARKRARKLAFEDPLTNLPNRLKFIEYLQGMLLYNQSSEQQAAVLCLDLNRFKRINNSIGQEAGDSVLQECVERWQAHLDKDLLMARTGGDEFMIFVPEYPSTDDLENLAEKLIETLREPIEVNDLEIEIRVNIGIALYPRDSEDVDGLLSMAHRAMVEARNHGFNNYEFFLSDMQDVPTNLVSLETDLRKAIENDDLSLHYQPQINMDDETITGFEALLRWEHSDRGMISPETTIPLAEETGLILPVGEWVLSEACQHLVEWQELTSKDLQVSVNVSAEQIVQKTQLLESVKTTINETNIDPACLELEITEHVALRDLNFTSDLLHEFQGMELRTSVDDFGTGHSTMTYLQELPYDCLKIDRSFIDGLAEYRQNRVMVEAMVSLGNELGLEVIAEGVETPAQLEILRDLGCDIAQGFYYAKPLPADKIENILTSKKELQTIQSMS